MRIDVGIDLGPRRGWGMTSRALSYGGELVLRGRATATLAGDADSEVTRACVGDEARLVVQDGAAITITGEQTTVIAGHGIVPAAGVAHLHVRIDVSGAADVFLLFDNATIPISALVYAPQSNVHIAITGRAGLTLERGGVMKSVLLRCLRHPERFSVLSLNPRGRAAAPAQLGEA